MKTAGRLYGEIDREFGREAGHLANVILNWQSQPVRKLRNLQKRLRRGESISLSQFDIDKLRYSGLNNQPMSILDTA